MRQLNRKEVKEELIDAIMKIDNFCAELRFNLINEIYPIKKRTKGGKNGHKYCKKTN